MGRAFLAGLLGGGAIAAYRAYQKGRELSGRGKALAQNLAEGGADLESYLVAQGSSIESELTQLAQEEATRVARASADQYMSDIYGLTPQRIERIGVIGAALKDRL
jgi:hypothetical protein